jgi:hypothetical protein
VAYQAYSAMLGVKLPVSALQTGDIDIAQFTNVSVAMRDRTPPVIDVLKTVDQTFRAVPHSVDGRRVTSYVARGGLRVDFLTPNEGPETDQPEALPALHTDAQPLRFLDYLIHEPEPAVILHNAGIYAQVPAPERYAVHKLIVSRRRRPGIVKRDKDLRQAEALLDALADKRPHELKLAWEEAYDRGAAWQRLLTEGASQLSPNARDRTLKIIGWRREMLPGLDLIFNSPPAFYDSRRDIVTFEGVTLDKPIKCAISRAALDDHFGAAGLGKQGRVKTFLDGRSVIEGMARTKFLSWPIEDINTVLIKTTDVPALLQR